MPKHIDHEAKRASIGRAVWAVLDDVGPMGLSVRAVADRAGVPASSLQYYFATREELVSHALHLAIEEQRLRIEGEDTAVDPAERVAEALRAILPLDETRRVEAQVWFSALISLRSPHHRKLLDDAEAGLDHLARWSVDVICGRDLPDEAVRLRAFMDGLALNALSRPGLMTEQMQREHLLQYLDDLRARHTGPRRAVDRTTESGGGRHE